MTFAQALEVRDRPGIDVGTSIISTFGTKRSLIVVDNCEHVVAGVAELVGQLVGGCPKVLVVASSRERLGLQAERIYEVPPMAISDGHALFVERASAVRPGFQPDEHVDAICDAVDQLPLAIELAAARVLALSTSAIHERLGERLGLLASRNRDVEERQRTLEATIAWSYELLDDDERRVLRGLSVFAGGCTLAAAESVAGADVEYLESLLDKSLIRHRIDEAGQDRYWMLETIREYAQRELEREGEADAAGTRYTTYFADLAIHVDAPSTFAVSDEQRDLFVSDRANFGEAHARALATGDGASALRFVRRLGRVTGVVGVERPRLVCEGCRKHRIARWHSRGPCLGACARCARGESHRRPHTSSELARRSRRPLRRARGRTREPQTQSGREPSPSYQPETTTRQSNSPNSSQRSHSPSKRRIQLPPLRGLEAQPEAQDLLAMALLGRALVEDDRASAERSRAFFAARADAPAGTVLEQASDLRDLAFSLFVLGAYSEGIATGQRSLSKLLELEATLEMESAWLSDALFSIGLSLCGRGDAGSGTSLVSAARRMYREDGVAEEDFTQRALSRIEKSARATLGDEGYETAVRKGEAMARDEAIELALSAPGD